MFRGAHSVRHCCRALGHLWAAAANLLRIAAKTQNPTAACPPCIQLNWRWFNRWLILSGAFANKQLLNVMDEMERQKYPKYIEEGKLTSWKYIATCVANQSYLILLQITFRLKWDCGWINIIYNQISKQSNKQSVSIICRKYITNQWYILAYWPVFKSLPS